MTTKGWRCPANVPKAHSLSAFIFPREALGTQQDEVWGIAFPKGETCAAKACIQFHFQTSKSTNTHIAVRVAVAIILLNTLPHTMASPTLMLLQARLSLPSQPTRWSAPMSTSTPPRTVPHTRSHHRWSSSSNHGDSPPLARRHNHRPRRQHEQHHEQLNHDQHYYLERVQRQPVVNREINNNNISPMRRSRWSETLCCADAPHLPTRKSVAVENDLFYQSTSALTGASA
jgi:hypothetical protein